MTKPQIKLVLVRENGHRSEVKVAGINVTETMTEAAEYLLQKLSYGGRVKTAKKGT